MDQKTRLQARSTSLGHCSNHNSNLKIVYRRIDTLQPDPANPRRHSEKQIRQIAESIKVFSFNVPILVDRHDKTKTIRRLVRRLEDLGCEVALKHAA